MAEPLEAAAVTVAEYEEEKGMTLEEFREDIRRRYEKRLGMTCEEFWQRWQEGIIEDTFWTTSWACEWGVLLKLERGELEVEEA
jgi:hypothetical protein